MTAQDETTKTQDSQAQATQAAPLKRTPLYEQHKALGGRMVEFGGWEMPVQYSSILDEHQAVRTNAGLFDVSHMGEFKVEGAGALPFLQYLVPNDVSKLAIGQALYTQLILPGGGTIDDLLVYHLDEGHYMLVVNAANIAKDFAWVQEQARNFPDVAVIDQSETTALLALQGPKAEAILQPFTDVDLSTIRYYHFAPGTVDGAHCIISRTGYTGEDGFELYCAPVMVAKLWNDLLEAGKAQGLKPAGLGARDTLRLEVCYPLHGNDIGPDTDAISAGLGWVCALDKDFTGVEELRRIKDAGPERKLAAFVMDDPGIPRQGMSIAEGGEVTSGSHSPMLERGIGMGYVPAGLAQPGSELTIDVRGRPRRAHVVKKPIYAGEEQDGV